MWLDSIESYQKALCASMACSFHHLPLFKFLILREVVTGDRKGKERHINLIALKMVLLERKCILHFFFFWKMSCPGQLDIFSEFCIFWTAGVDSGLETWFSVCLLQELDIKRQYLSYHLLFLPMHLWKSRSGILQFTFTDWCISSILCSDWENPPRNLILWVWKSTRNPNEPDNPVSHQPFSV